MLTFSGQNLTKLGVCLCVHVMDLRIEKVTFDLTEDAVALARSCCAPCPGLRPPLPDHLRVLHPLRGAGAQQLLGHADVFVAAPLHP